MRSNHPSVRMASKENACSPGIGVRPSRLHGFHARSTRGAARPALVSPVFTGGGGGGGGGGGASRPLLGPLFPLRSLWSPRIPVPAHCLDAASLAARFVPPRRAALQHAEVA